MKRLFSFLAALVICVFAYSGVAHAWGTASGDGSRFTQLQETAVFFNNSGGSLSAGDVVIMDRTGTGVTAGSTLGAYITTQSAAADHIEVLGVVKSRSVADLSPVVVVTKGPIDTRCRDASDAVTTGTAVGTAIYTKECGGGTNLGWALEPGDSTDHSFIFIWVDPTGAD